MIRETDVPYDPDVWARFVRAKRTAAGNTIIGFAVVLRISPSYLGQLEQGVRPTPARLKSMAENAGDNPVEWFTAAGYSESMIPPGSKTVVVSDQPVLNPQQLAVTRLPEIGMVVLDGRIVIDEDADPDQVIYLDCSALQAATASYILRVLSDAAFPIITVGDLIGVQDGNTARPGEVVVVEGAGDKWLLRYHGRQQACRRFSFVNPIWPAQLEGIQLEIVGRVMWIMRGIEVIRRFRR